MPNFLITYNFENTAERKEFIDYFIKVITDLGFVDQQTNQSTFYGSYKSLNDLHFILFDKLSQLDWRMKDMVTIYYPETIHYVADILSFQYKKEGNSAPEIPKI